MDRIHNFPCNHHLLLLGQSDIGLLVRSNQFPEVAIAHMAIASTATATYDIVGSRLLNLRVDQRNNSLVLTRNSD